MNVSIVNSFGRPALPVSAGALGDAATLVAVGTAATELETALFCTAAEEVAAAALVAGEDAAGAAAEVPDPEELPEPELAPEKRAGPGIL